MLKLTEKEKLNLQKKFDAFTNFNDIFTHTYSIGPSFFNAFTSKEVLSEDFYPRMYNEIHKYHPFLDYFRTILLDRDRRDQLTADFFSSLNLSEEDAFKLADELISIVSRSHLAGDLVLYYITVIENIILKYKSSKEEVLLYLFDRGVFKFVERNYLTSFIDNLVSKEKITDPIALIKLIQKKIPNYNNFPLIILNDSIDKETKIKAIKASYRQKDLPQYKIYFRKNIRDFDLIDIFLQATVIQNNRVKEKEAGIIDFFKKIFINGEESPLEYDDLLHAKEFATKYIDYFRDKAFMRRFYIETVKSMSTNTYRRDRQFKTFCMKLFKDFSFDEKVDLATNNLYLYIFRDTSDLFNDACDNSDADKIGKLANMFISWYMEDPDFDKFCNNVGNPIQLDKIISTHPEIIKNFLSEYTVYDTSDKKHGCYKHSDIVFDTINGPSNKKFALSRSPDLIKSMKFFTPEDAKYLGFNYDVLKKRQTDHDCRNSYQDIQGIVRGDKAVFRFCNNVLCDEALKLEDRVEIAEAFKKTFNIKYFMDEENVALLTDSVMRLNQDPYLKHDNTSWNSGNPTAQLYLDVVDLFREIIVKMSELLNDESLLTIDSNFQDSKETIKLICALQ